MKNKLLFLICILYASISYSQDKIYKQDGTEILAKIIEVNLTDIKYKKYSNLEGPIYTIVKADVVMIIYANGDTEVLATPKESPSPTTETTVDYNQLEEKNKNKNIYGKNILAINIIPFVFKDLNLSYERFFAKQKWAIKIPLYIGYTSNTSTQKDISRFEYFSTPQNKFPKTISYSIVNGVAAGIHLKCYPTGEGIIRGFIGIGVELGTFTFIENVYPNTSHFPKKKHEYIGGVLNGGIVCQPNKLLNCSLDLGIAQGGYTSRVYASNGFENKNPPLVIRIGITVGVRF